MEIVIPESKIFGFSINILEDNYIDNVSINQNNTNNLYNDFNFKLTNNNGDITLSNILANSESPRFVFQERLQDYSPNIDEEDDQLLPSKVIYYVFTGYVEFPNFDVYDVENFANNITTFYGNFYKNNSSNVVTWGNFLVSVDDNYSSAEINIDGKKGNVIFNKTLIDNKLYFKMAYEYNTGYDYIDIQVEITPNVQIQKNYNYSIGNTGDYYEITANSFIDIYSRDSSNNMLSSLIANRILEEYKLGKMTMELETRVSTFKYSNNYNVNNGKEYLIKVGDIVKPIINQLNNLEHIYLVTSSEYNYNGAEVVNLKLLEIVPILRDTITYDSVSGIGYDYPYNLTRLSSKDLWVVMSGKLKYTSSSSTGQTIYVEEDFNDVKIDIEVGSGNSQILLSYMLDGKEINIYVKSDIATNYYSIYSSNYFNINDLIVKEYY